MNFEKVTNWVKTNKKSILFALGGTAAGIALALGITYATRKDDEVVMIEANNEPMAIESEETIMEIVE